MPRWPKMARRELSWPASASRARHNWVQASCRQYVAGHFPQQVTLANSPQVSECKVHLEVAQHDMQACKTVAQLASPCCYAVGTVCRHAGARGVLLAQKSNSRPSPHFAARWIRMLRMCMPLIAFLWIASVGCGAGRCSTGDAVPNCSSKCTVKHYSDSCTLADCRAAARHMLRLAWAVHVKSNASQLLPDQLCACAAMARQHDVTTLQDLL